MINLSYLFSKLDIDRNSNIILTSNLLSLIKTSQSKDIYEIGNDILSEIVEFFKDKGTVVIPSFNWDFCKGKIYDYNKSPSQVGSLANLALKNPNFKRTYHAIYSFLTYGALSNELIKNESIDSFSEDSVINYLYIKRFKHIYINLEIEDGFFFVHLAEQKNKVDYRFIKKFDGKYIDKDGLKKNKVFSMYVRKNESSKWHIKRTNKVVYTAICNSFEKRLSKENAFISYEKNSIKIKSVDVFKAVNLMSNSISKNGCLVFPRIRHRKLI